MKVVAIISQHQDLVELIQEHDAISAEMIARIDSLQNEAIAQKDSFFRRLEASLIELKLVPADTDFTDKNVQVSKESDAIRVGDKEEDDSGLPEFLKQLLVRKHKKSKGENDVD